MNKGKLSLVITAKALRSFFNGLFCCSLVPYSQHLYFKIPPYFTSLTIFLCALAAVLKSHLINKYINNPLRALYISYLFFIPALCITQYNLTDAWPTLATKIIFILGLHPTDGEDFAFFQEAERSLISPRTPHNNRHKGITAYNLIGSLFQALGSLAAYAYMTYDLQAIQYVTMVRLSEIYVILYFLAVANIFSSYALRNAPLGKKVQIAHFVNGLAVGVLCAPFLAYFLDYKFNVHYNTLGVIIFALFFLKAVGEELIYRLSSLRRYFEYWNLLSVLALALIYFTTDTNVAIYCLLFSVPVWNFGRAALRQRVESWGVDEMGGEWEKGGTVVGILLSSFAFNIIYFQPYFAYSFLLCAAFKMVSQLFISIPLEQMEAGRIQSRQQMSQIYSPVEHDVIPEESSRIDGKANPANTVRQGYSFQRNKFPLIFLAILIVAYSLYAYPTYLRHQSSYLKAKTETIITPPQLKFYNSSLAHLWVKEGVKGVTLIDCDKDCIQSIEKRDQFYAQMQYDSPNPKWVHFPNAPYFRSASQMQTTDSLLC